MSNFQALALIEFCVRFLSFGLIGHSSWIPSYSFIELIPRFPSLVLLNSVSNFQALLFGLSPRFPSFDFIGHCFRFWAFGFIELYARFPSFSYLTPSPISKLCLCWLQFPILRLWFFLSSWPDFQALFLGAVRGGGQLYHRLPAGWWDYQLPASPPFTCNNNNSTLLDEDKI